MNRIELTLALAARTGLIAHDCSRVVDALADVMRDCVRTGTCLHLPGLLTLDRVERPARAGRNPRTGEALVIPAGRTVKLTPGSSLKAAAKENR